MKLKAQEKKIDHIERAKRVVEIPMLKDQWIQEEKLRIEVRYFDIVGGGRGNWDSKLKLGDQLKNLRTIKKK